MMRIAYADPVYPGVRCDRYYRSHPDYAGMIDQRALCRRLVAEFDGFVLHTSSVALGEMLSYFPTGGGIRVMAWVKPFAAFKRNVPVAYAWEPVLVKACRTPVVSGRIVMRDWVSEKITLKKGLTGAKPEAVARWAFEVVGAKPDDELVDMFPGTGAIGRAWDVWRRDVAEAA